MKRFQFSLSTTLVVFVAIVLLTGFWTVFRESKTKDWLELGGVWEVTGRWDEHGPLPIESPVYARISSREFSIVTPIGVANMEVEASGNEIVLEGLADLNSAEFSYEGKNLTIRFEGDQAFSLNLIRDEQVDFELVRKNKKRLTALNE